MHSPHEGGRMVLGMGLSGPKLVEKSLNERFGGVGAPTADTMMKLSSEQDISTPKWTMNKNMASMHSPHGGGCTVLGMGFSGPKLRKFHQE